MGAEFFLCIIIIIINVTFGCLTGSIMSYYKM